MLTLHRIEEPVAPPARNFALWQLGFRPFYLCASVFAALSIPLWALQFSGLLGHAYLTASKMTMRPFGRLNSALAIATIVRALSAVPLAMFLLRRHPIESVCHSARTIPLG